jgi:shikimate kinase
MSTLVLVGAPGSGKSTVGALLAERLGVPFRDVDAVIAERTGKSISEIFTDDGEATFRALEEQVTAELLPLPGVLSLGGGAVLSATTRAALRDHGVVWLKVGLAQSVKRVGLDTARPLLLGNVRGQLRKLLDERAALYREVGNEVVDTDHTTPAEIVEMIMNAHAAQH